MCDTFVALPSHTASRHLILGKNSDREPNEAQAIVRIPRRQHDESWVHCTYIEIPQVAETNEVILSKPFQMWGAEMGVNEHGVVIGNEAVFTRIRFRKKNDGLTGMDLLRLALERTATATAALDCITTLLADYGQDACGGYRNRNFFYHNSFLIADRREAWVLETAGRHWAAQQVRDFRSISNGLTIGEDYDLLSEGAIDFVRRRGWIRKGETFHFQRVFSDWFYTRMSHCRQRQLTSSQMGLGHSGRFTVSDAMSILRTHHPHGNSFTPGRATAASLCMHATGLTNPSQTTGSMIAVIRQNGPATVWLTGTSLPCLAVYKPFFFGGKSLLPPEWPLPSAQPDLSLWWRAEAVHRQISQDYRNRKAQAEESRKHLEEDIRRETAHLLSERPTAKKLDEWSEKALNQYDSWLKDRANELKALNLQWAKRFGRYARYVQRQNRRAGLS